MQVLLFFFLIGSFVFKKNHFYILFGISGCLFSQSNGNFSTLASVSIIF